MKKLPKWTWGPLAEGLLIAAFQLDILTPWFDFLGIGNSAGLWSHMLIAGFLTIRLQVIPDYFPLFLWPEKMFYVPSRIQTERGRLCKLDGFGDRLFVDQDGIYKEIDPLFKDLFGFFEPAEERPRVRTIQQSCLISPRHSLEKARIYRLKDGTSNRYFINYLLTWIEIDDLYSFQMLRTQNESFKTSTFWNLDSEPSRNKFRISEIRKDFHVEHGFSIEHLRNLFQQRCVDTWLKARYFPGTHLTGKLDETINQFANRTEVRLALHESLQIDLNNLRRIDAKLDEGLTTNRMVVKALVLDLKELIPQFLAATEAFQKLIQQDDVFTQDIVQVFGRFSNWSERASSLGSSRGIDKRTLRFIREVIFEVENTLNKIVASTNYLGYSNLLLVGKAYIGKTHAMANSVDQRLFLNLPSELIEARPSLATNWATVIDDDGLGRFFGCGINDLVMQLSSLAKNIDRHKPIFFNDSSVVNSATNFIIHIDGLDEAKERWDQWCNLITQTSSSPQSDPRIRFIFTTRPEFHYACQANTENLTIKHVDGVVVPLGNIFDHYQKKYSRNDLDQYPWLRNAFINPLQIRVFFEAIEGYQVDPNQIALDLSTLFDNILQKLALNLESVKRVPAALVQIILQHLQNLVIEKQSEYIVLTDLYNTVQNNDPLYQADNVRVTISELEQAAFLRLIKGDNDVDYVMFGENSMYEYAYARKLLIRDEQPTDCPEMLITYSGALLDYASARYRETSELIGRDYWDNQIQEEQLHEVYSRIFSSIAPNSINANDVRWVLNELIQ